MPQKSIERKAEFSSQSPSFTRMLGARLAALLARSASPREHALLIGLKGELGSGKTTFIQGFAQGMGVKEKILSPTFVIQKEFSLPKNKAGYQRLYHIDCYRVEQPEELLSLGWDEITANRANVLLVEWAENVRDILPPHTSWVEFSITGGETRSVACSGFRNALQ